MKRILSLILILTMSLSLYGCVNNKTEDTKTTLQSKASTADTAKIETSIPERTIPEVTAVPVINTISGITLENYPVVDGSTATIPLAIGLIRKITGCTSAVSYTHLRAHE